MPTMQKMAHALGFYIQLKNVSGEAKDVCLAAADYHEFLADVVSAVAANTNYFADYLLSLDGDTRTENDVDEILGRVNEILGTREFDRQRVNGLVVGRVQSGKTRNYIVLMLKAVEEGVERSYPPRSFTKSRFRICRRVRLIPLSRRKRPVRSRSLRFEREAYIGASIS